MSPQFWDIVGYSDSRFGPAFDADSMGQFWRPPDMTRAEAGAVRPRFFRGSPEGCSDSPKMTGSPRLSNSGCYLTKAQPIDDSWLLVICPLLIIFIQRKTLQELTSTLIQQKSLLYLHRETLTQRWLRIIVEAMKSCCCRHCWCRCYPLPPFQQRGRDIVAAWDHRSSESVKELGWSIGGSFWTVKNHDGN